MKYKLLMFLWVYSIAFSSYAQNAIKGKVTDEHGEPLPGVTIEATQTPVQRTSTDINGNYTISVKAKNAILMFKFIGYKPQGINLNGRSAVDVKMEVDNTQLKEILVMGALGIERSKNSVTYASQSVSMESITENRDLNIVNALAGKVAGLQITTTGQPGSSSRLILRGEGSVSGNNQPLWVVDGVPIENQMGETSDLDYGNGAADLNPDDIESIEVIKGPGGAALYGQKAANGVILVTTKKAKIGDKNFGITVGQNMQNYSIMQFPEYQNVYGEGVSGRLVPDPASIYAGTGAVNMGTRNVSWGAAMLGQPYNTFSGQPHGYNPQPDNVTSLYKSSYTNVGNVSIAKADAVSAFRSSYTFTNGNDVMDNQNLKKKHNLNLTASRKLNDKISVDVRLNYTNDNTKNRTYRNMNAFSPMSSYVYMARSADVAAFSPWKDENGRSVQRANLSTAENPYWSIYENENQDKHSRFIGGVTVNASVTKDLKFRGQVNGDMDFGRSYIYRDMGARIDTNGYYRNMQHERNNWNYEALLSYNKKLTKDLTLKANAGGNINKRGYRVSTVEIEALYVPDKPTVSNASVNPINTESGAFSQINSLFASANLGYKNMLYLDVTTRNEWSSTLPSGTVLFYPSVGTSFVFSELIKNKSILNYGKLRVSWAKAGNSPQAYQLLNGYTSGGIFLGNPVLSYDTQRKNAELKPEQKVATEIGLDLGFLKDRMQLSATVYKDNTTNQLLQANTAYETGFTSRILNAGEIMNKGIELTLTTVPIKKKDLTWTFTANWSKNINKVLSLADGVPVRQLGGQILGASSNAVVGMPYGVIIGRGPYMDGDKVLVQANGRVFVEENLMVGTFRPDWLGSLQNSIRYKGFDISALVSVKWGGLLYSATWARATSVGNTSYTLDPVFGRQGWFFGRGILGENGTEATGLVSVNGANVPYQDWARSKGGQYPNSYYLKTVNGVIQIDANGRYVAGEKNISWIDPQNIANDMVLNNVPAATFDATNIRIDELTFGYTVPKKTLGKFAQGFLSNARFALVARNPLIIYQKTPHGIDPNSANTTGNQQGIENGGSFPFRQIGFDLRLSF